MTSPMAWTDPATLVQIRQARDRIQLDQSAQTELVHNTVQQEFPTVVEQYRTSVDVQKRLAETASSIAQLQRGLHDVQSLATPLLDLLRTRARHTTAQRTASHRLRTLQTLQTRVNAIRHAEEQLQAGNGEVDAVLDLRSRKELGAAAVEGQLRAREGKIVSAAEAQLQDGFERSLRAFVADETRGEMRLQTDVALRVVSLTNKSTDAPAYHPHKVSLRHLTSSLHDLGLLSSLLGTFQNQVLKYLVKPLVQSYADGQRLVVRKDEDEGGIRVRLVQDAQEDGLRRSLRIIIDTLLIVLPTPPATDPSANAIASFHRHISSDTLLAIRDMLLLPLLSRASEASDTSTATTALIHWVDILEKAVAFEESLGDGTRPHARVIRDFAEGRAGAVYVNARKSRVLDSVRGQVVRVWGKWEGRVVERERKVGSLDTSKENEKVAKAEPSEMTQKNVKAVQDKTDDGWSFDDEASTVPLPAQLTDKPAEEDTTSGTVEEADGWGFDDDDLPSATTSNVATADAPIRPASPVEDAPPLITAPKPIRQARKIGKKAKASANTTSEGSRTASPALDGDSAEGFATPTTATPAASLMEDKRADGWEMEWEPEPVVPVPSHEMPVSDQVRERMKVSVVLDDVLAIVRAELEFVDAFQKAGVTLSTFTSAAGQLATIPSETLELVRALVLTLYEAQIRDNPALALQFANDCAWLAERVQGVLDQAVREGVAVDGLAKQVDKLVAVSAIVLNRQVETQMDGITDILADLGGLENTSDDQKFQRCTRAFQEVHHKLETLFRVYKDVMTESSCLTTMGQLIDAAISFICSDVLAVVDITAEESERLKQLCLILRPIEQQFNVMNVNILAFVPHWLRFCYLSEIMEASLVDITYLLESGALVDFTSDELVHLLLALFTDTPNRADLIGKVMARPRT